MNTVFHVFTQIKQLLNKKERKKGRKKAYLVEYQKIYVEGTVKLDNHHLATIAAIIISESSRKLMNKFNSLFNKIQKVGK